MGSIADKLRNIRKAKKELADKFYINDITPLADFVNLISNTEDIKIGFIDADKNFTPHDTDEAVAVQEFYEFEFAEDVVIPEPERVENQTYSPAKTQNILDAKNAIKTKFGLGDVLSEYAETIPLGDSVILGHTNTDKNFQDVVFYDKIGVPKNTAKSAEFYRYVYSEIDAPSSLTFTAYQDITFSIQLTASASSGLEVVFTAANLPDGLTCSSGGIISGVPTTTGSFTSTVVVSSHGAISKVIRINFTVAVSLINTPLTFTAEESDTTVTLNVVGSPTVSGLQYRTDTNKEFTTYTRGTTVTLRKAGDVVQFRNTAETLSKSTRDYVNFSVEGKVSLSGNMQSMLNFINSCKPYCYLGMFLKCTGLTAIHDVLLPAKTLAESCYAGMFNVCTGLTAIPEGLLPAETLAKECYNTMFSSCTGLTSIPERLLHAKTLAYGCYNGMFNDCTGLTAIPAGLLPAETLAEYCYARMFNLCTRLTAIPEGLLPAETLAEFCYSNMFNGCTRLTAIPEGLLPIKTLAKGCYYGMFYGCVDLTSAPDLPATTLAERCYSYMFGECTSLTKVPTHFTAWLEGATEGWLSNVAATGTFECRSVLDITVERGADTIPEGWHLVFVGY